MKKTITNYGLILMVLVLTFSSCSQRLIDFTVISSKNVSIGIDKSKGVRVVGKSMQFLMMGVNIKDAMDNALHKAGNGYDLLIDGVVRIEQYPFYGGYVVEGTAVNTAKMKAQMGEAGFADWCKANNVLDPNSHN